MINIYKFQEYLGNSSYFMHIINLARKEYIMQVDYETTVGTTVLENIGFFLLSQISNSSRPQFKIITIFPQIPLFYLLALAAENLRKSFLIVKCRNYNHFLNNLRLFDVLSNFSFTANATTRDYYL